MSKPDWTPLFGVPLATLKPGSPWAVSLAATLEVLRMQVCAYVHPGSHHDVTCDCKFGLGEVLTSGASLPRASSEKTGCPELREVIGYLLGE